MDDKVRSGRADVHSPERRSFNMSRIRGRDTKPEMLIRRGLHARGFRFRLHARDLPGRPDLTFPKHRAVIQVHGCFWHGHDCPMFRLPTTCADFWRAKIEANRARDAWADDALEAAAWRRLTVWECTLRGPVRQSVSEALDACECFLTGRTSSGELTGRWNAGEGQ